MGEALRNGSRKEANNGPYLARCVGHLPDLLYRGYGEGIVLHAGDGLVVHRCDDGCVIVIEYEVHGRVVGSGAAYENRFVSIVTVENRKIVHWRDYMDSLSAMRALSIRI